MTSCARAWRSHATQCGGRRARGGETRVRTVTQETWNWTRVKSLPCPCLKRNGVDSVSLRPSRLCAGLRILGVLDIVPRPFEEFPPELYCPVTQCDTPSPRLENKGLEGAG